MSTPVLPVPLGRIRTKLLVFVALAVVATVGGLPAPAVTALWATSLAIPLVVALAGGARAVRELFLPRRPMPGPGGLGHSQEQGERFVT